MLDSLEIIRFGTDGEGIGKHFSKNVHVAGTIPAEIVSVTPFRKRRAIDATLDAVLTPSPDRIVPRCVHFGLCGGCRWQHISYQRQLQEKESMIRTLFPSEEMRPIIPCTPEWQYRNKMDFSFSQNRAEEHFLGLMMSRGRVINLTECHLANPWMVETLGNVRNWWIESGLEAYHPRNDNGSLRTLVLRESRNGDRLAMLTVSGNADFALKRPHLDSFVKTIGEGSVFLRIQQIAKGRPTQFYEMHLSGKDHIEETLKIKNAPFRFHISPSAFFQPNTKQAEKLYTTALEMAEIGPQDVVYDLYCGTGTLGISVSKQAKQVIAIEISPESVVDARTNIALNGCTNVEIVQGDVGKMLEEGHFPPPDVLLIDPPRVGLDPRAIAQILQLNAKRIVYISCNPKTQSANVKELVGYRIKAIQPVDQFPHTVHIENIVLLERL